MARLADCVVAVGEAGTAIVTIAVVVGIIVRPMAVAVAGAIVGVPIVGMAVATAIVAIALKSLMALNRVVTEPTG